MTLKQGANFDVEELRRAIEQMNYRPGELKATLTGILTEISQADGIMKRKALKAGDSDQQSYILLENAPLQEQLKTAKMDQSATLTGLLSTYKKKHYLWISPEKEKLEKVVSLKGQFLAKRNSLVFKNGADEYFVLENAQRAKVENTKGYAQKEWTVKALVANYQGAKYLLLKEG